MGSTLAPPAKRGTTRRQRDELYGLIEAGYFGEARVELIGGELVTSLPETNLHGETVDRIYALFSEAFASGAAEDGLVYRQDYIELPHGDAIQPDVFVLRGESAEEPLLVVEVAIGTLRRDRTVKSELYAAANVQEYWVVNPRARQVEVRTDPSGVEFVTHQIFEEGEAIRPVFAPKLSLLVDRLFSHP